MALFASMVALTGSLITTVGRGHVSETYLLGIGAGILTAVLILGIRTLRNR